MIKLLNPLLVRLNLKGKCDDVFKKLPLEERQIIKKYKNQIAGTITILSVTALVLGNTVATDYLNSIDNNIYATPSYTVKVDGRDICNVRNKDVIEPTVAQIQNDLEKEANLDLTFENKFEVVRSKSKQKDITSEENIYSVLKAEVDYSLIGYAIKVNGNTVGVVDSKETANKVLDQVKAYFTQTYDPNSIIELTTAEDVKIEQAKVDFKAIQKAEGNFPCFKASPGGCDQKTCLWREDCLSHN
jgi:ribosomal protein S17E